MNDHEPGIANIAVIRGPIRDEPVVRELPGGGVVAQFDLSTETESDGGRQHVSVPIAWADPTAAQLGVLTAGNELVVVGSVRRRFFRVGGATQSRTEVVADAVIPVRRRAQVARALGAVADRLVD